jgi:hypothetical protein
MGNVKKKQRPKANVDHIAHQVNVSGVGAHKSKKEYDRKENRKIIKEQQ